MNYRRGKKLFQFWCTVFGLTAISGLVLAQSSSPGGGVDDASLVFQLEGNATRDASFGTVAFGANTEDWQTITLGTSHALATTGIVGDTTNSTSDNIFTGGSSKDIYDVNSWQYKAGKPQGKDDIAHAFAAAYTLATPNCGTPGNACHTAIYFGMDRFDNSGDSTAGFWFFQDSTVSLCTGPRTPQPACTKAGTFSGRHVDGDLLIVSDFSTGGAVSTIQVFKWSGSALVAAEAAITTNATCNPTTGNSSLCAIVNPLAGTTSPWGFTNKTGQTTFGQGEFLEGGLDLNAIFGANIPCFTTFMAETRASNSPTSTLSDFSAPASFPLCSITATMACNGSGTLSSDGSSVNYSWTGAAVNTGMGKVFDVDVTDTLPDGSQTTSRIVGPTTTPNYLAANSSASFTIEFAANASNVTNPLDVINTATIKAAASEGGPQTIIFPKSPTPPATGECKASVNQALSVIKHCDADFGGATLQIQGTQVVAEVFYTYQVCNNGTVPLTNIALADNTGSPNSTTLPTIASVAPASCSPVLKGTYFPQSIDSTLGRYAFTDTVRVTGANGAFGVALTAPTPNACPSSTDLACASVTCPVAYDSTCTGNPLP
ncbi:MAG: hypothetical protein DMG25_08690 [Acidobacteria bacterium]|nr:MAG: hypothetical protein DMG25_08690 [Acidobacteriota bacterium]